MSGSGSAGGDHGGQLFFCRHSSGDHQPAAGFADMGSIFLSSQISSAACDAGAGGDGGGGPITTPPAYDDSSIAEYLQGFLGYPSGLASHLDDAAADSVKQPGSSAAGGAAVTPNSSTSSEAAAEDDEHRRWKKKGRPEEEDEGEVDEEAASADHQKCRCNGLKKEQKKTEEEKKKKKGARARGSRVAFATKSEVDHLDDGYRWRKYGQKAAVKNSSYPRSYYRCTAARCGVKKQVERSQQDPSTVITTYEGHHQHPSPITCRLPPPLTMLAAYHSSLAAAAHTQRQLLHHGFCPDADGLAAYEPQAAAEYYYGPQELLPDFVMDNRQHGQT